MDEAFRVRGVGLGQHGAALGTDLLGGAEVDRGGVCSPMPEWRSWWLYMPRNSAANAAAIGAALSESSHFTGANSAYRANR